MDKKLKMREMALATVAASSVCAAPVFAEGETTVDLSNYDTQLKTEFQGAATKIGGIIVAVIGFAMGIIVVKQVFKAGVSFFKSASSK